MHTQREFFKRVLSTDGLPCLGWLTKDSKGKPQFSHKTFNNVDNFCNALAKIDYTKQDTYFCISTLKEHSTKDPTGKSRVRTQANSKSTRAFILDVDVRPEKKGFYATKEEALKGIANVCEMIQLPKPIIVDSGFGLHVYWTMAAGIPSAKWAGIANQLKKAIVIIAPEVGADGSRTADCAGVLRIPASFNLKNGQLTPVNIIQWSDDVVDVGVLGEFLDRVAGVVPESGGLSGVRPTSLTQSEPVELTKVGKNCNWTKEYLANAATASEPEWYAMLGLVPFLKHTGKEGKEKTGADIAHMFSKNHPEYDAEATYNKYIQAKNAQQGPTTCERLQGINSERCVGCPFATSVKSPIHTAAFSREATEPEEKEVVVKDEKGNVQKEKITIPLPPKPYFRGQDGGIQVRVPHKPEGDSKEWTETIEIVYKYDLYPTRRFRTESLENEGMEIHLWLPKDGLRKFRLPNELLADVKALNKFMNMKGVVPAYGKAPLVSKYMIDYIRYLQEHKAAEVEYSHFGWRDINTATPKFIVSDGFYDCEGNLQPGTVADYLRQKGSNDKALSPSSAVDVKGTLEEWKKGFAVYENMPDSDPYLLAALTGFAAPLFGFTEYNGMIYSMMGDRGAGKSTALKVMSSVFGIPAESRLRIDDTVISSFNTIGYLNSVAVAFDEITSMEPKNISDFVLAFTGGRGKTRADQSGQNKVNETTWGTVVVVSSNTSINDKYAAHRKGYGAEGSRSFELQVVEADARYKAHVDACIDLIRNNYGHAGREFIKYIMPRTTAIRNIINRTIAALDKRAGFRPYERFYCAYLACILVAGEISGKVLKLHNYDTRALIDRILGVSLPEVRAQLEAAASDPVSCLGEFFNSNLSSLLRVNNGLIDLGSMSGNMHQIKARLEYSNGKPTFAYISIAAVREYCKTRNIDPSWMRQGLSDAKIILANNLQIRLTTGSSLPSINCRCWKIDMNNEKLAGLVIDETAVLPQQEPTPD